jgi:GT2 family glycosyltransferase/glycosyltransferase involved in cell wall biosynthesis
VVTDAASTPAPRRRLGGLLQRLRFLVARVRTVPPRLMASLRARGLRGTIGRIGEWWRARRAPIETGLELPARGDEVRIEELAFAVVEAPVASIVVPVHNALALTLECLQSLVRHRDATSFEVIVVDDASSDATARTLPRIPGLRVVRLDKNAGFIGACNAGAAQARGAIIVFLNNDTYVQPGWLGALVGTFATHPDTGLAGAKLVYPYGALQEAGGIVFADGSAWNYGRHGDRHDPRYEFVREADYCSGAAIAIPRALFDELGGFDPHYAPAYYEDTDLAMRVRQHGLKVRYQPASVVVHHEGATSGTDVSTGIKAYQVANHRKFLERWRDVLAASHPSPALATTATVARASDHRRKRRVLVLDACTPTPDRDSGSVRMFELMRLLLELDCSVCFLNENQMHDGDYTRALQQLGVEAWWQPWSQGIPRWLEHNGADLDLVVASRHYVLTPVLPLLRMHAPRACIVFDTVDLHFLRDERAAELSGSAAARQAAQRTRAAELRLVDAVDVTWVVSPVEKQLLASLRPEAPVEVVSNIIRDQPPMPGPEGRRGLLFVGSFRHPPNADAVRWLVSEIMPRVRALRPDVELHVVGADLPADLAASQVDGVHWHGHVPDLDPLLRACRLSVAPLRFGAGVKGKVNQALAAGLPVVATTCAVEGMALRDGEDVLVADDAEAFAAQVARGCADDALWTRLAAAGRENTRRHFSPDVAKVALSTLLESLPERRR